MQHCCAMAVADAALPVGPRSRLRMRTRMDRLARAGTVPALRIDQLNFAPFRVPSPGSPVPALP
ncbi:hypothetical protein FHR55_001588 [Xanthomonas arboricola]